MKITDMLTKEFILDEFSAENKKDALAELAGVFTKTGIVLDLDQTLQVLLDREKLGSTGIGEGVAIPHGKIRRLADVLVAFGRSRQGIDFDATDSKPVHLLFLLLAPENSAGQHLKLLAKIAKMLKDPVFKKDLMKARTAEDLYTVISEKDDEI